MSSCSAPESSGCRRRSLCRRVAAQWRLSIGCLRRRARRASAIAASFRGRGCSPICSAARSARSSTPRIAIPARTSATAPALHRAGGLALFPCLHPTRKAASGQVTALALFAASDEHLRLSPDAGASGLLRDGGWIKAFRTARGSAYWGMPRPMSSAVRRRSITLDRAALAALEPHLGEGPIGGVHFTDPLSTSDPGALVHGYAALFVKPRRAAGSRRRALLWNLRARAGWS